MNKEEIIKLWKSVGWNTLTDYHEYIKFAEEKIILKELDADKVNPKEFWKASDQHFGTDPVCNHNRFTLDQSLVIEEANKLNFKIPSYLGMIGQLELAICELRNTIGYVNILEIGCGYGSFYDYFIKNKYPEFSYKGFDIIPRIPCAEEVEGDDGCFSKEQVLKYKEKYNLYFSSNTFQHLSKNQVRKYLTQVYDMLPYGGYFSLMYVNEEESYHYGQKIELFSIEHFKDYLKNLGYNIIGYSSLNITNSLTPFSFLLKK